MPSSRRTLPLALALLLAATAFGAHGSVPPGYQVQSVTALAPGVDHESLTLPDPAQDVHVARVAPGAARLRAVSSHDAVAHQDAGAELPSDMCRRVGCFAGINADFSDPLTRQPVGGVVSGGRLVRSPVPGRAQLIVTRDGGLQAGPLEWAGEVAASDGRTVTLGGVNVSPRPGDAVLFTPAWGGDTPAGAEIELVVRAAGPIGAIGAIGVTTVLELVAARNEPGPIPADGAILAAAGGSASAALREFAAGADAGSISRTLDLRIRTAVDVIESVGGNPIVLRDGQPAFADVDDSFTRARHPRSLVGWNPAGAVVLVTVDAGRPDASGMTLAEAADLLVGLGATDGFGFDNAAVTFVAAGEVRNLPIDDGDPAPPPAQGREIAPGHVERPAANALMVVANPPPAPPPAKPGTGAGPHQNQGGTTATTAPLKVTTAGGAPAPTPGAAAAPPAAPAPSLLPGVGDILRDPTTTRLRRQPGKGGKGNRGEAGQEEDHAGDPSIPDWNDITAALTPEAVPGRAEPAELSLGLDPIEEDGPRTDVGALLIRLLATGMIVTVLWGLHRVRDDSRPQPALWL